MPTVNGKKKIYIAGPMTGLPWYNFEAFNDAAKWLQEAGWHPLNPAEFDLRLDDFDPFSMEDASSVVSTDFLQRAMIRDVNLVMHEADAIALLPRWATSTGAIAEYALAKWKHIPAYFCDIKHNSFYELPDHEIKRAFGVR